MNNENVQHGVITLRLGLPQHALDLLAQPGLAGTQALLCHAQRQFRLPECATYPRVMINVCNMGNLYHSKISNASAPHTDRQMLSLKE